VKEGEKERMGKGRRKGEKGTRKSLEKEENQTDYLTCTPTHSISSLD
jgi:hypothetical protein